MSITASARDSTLGSVPAGTEDQDRATGVATLTKGVRLMTVENVSRLGRAPVPDPSPDLRPDRACACLPVRVGGGSLRVRIPGSTFPNPPRHVDIGVPRPLELP